MDTVTRLRMLSRLFVKAQNAGEGKAEELFACVVNAIEDRMDDVLEQELYDYVIELQYAEAQANENSLALRRELQNVRQLLPKEIED